MSKHIDAKGKSCPVPVVMAKQAITDGDTAFVVEVDNQTAVENLKRLADSQGFQALVGAQGDNYTLTFTKGKTVAVPSPKPTGDYAVFVGRDIIGSGDRELGTNLMRMFFYTLVNSEDLPRSVLFMNDGVKLPSLDEQVAEHLKALSAMGVEILVCGACLNFHGIAEGLKVGTVSNMYDITSRMQAASKVISL